MPPKKYWQKYKRNNSVQDRPQNNHNKSSRIQISALMISYDMVGLDIPYSVISSDWPFKNLIKDAGGKWNKPEKLWVMPIADYSSTLAQILQYCKQKGYFFAAIPKFAYQSIKQMPLQLKFKAPTFTDTSVISYPQIQLYIEPESLPFYDKLYQFQRQSLKFGISKHGRLLLADEMGVGKTIQSLAIAYIYRSQWPLLIICPSTLRYNWQNQILNWYSTQIKKSQIQVYTKGGTPLKDNTKILIISYELAWKFRDMIADFQVAIADQAHYLKNSGCKRTDILVPLLSEKRRVILLTGTPAFARPRQIYNLISIIRPQIFTNFKQFGNRYCDPQRNPWSGMIEYNGCKNSKQLFFLIKNRIMLRRLKKEVLDQLPDKQRQKIIVQTNKNICKEINGLITQGSSMSTAEDLIMEMFGMKSEQFDNKRDRDKIMEAYRLTGSAKTEGVIQYIISLLENDAKILVFAHHQIMLNAIQEALVKKKYKFIRIDGHVEIQERQERVEQFQKQQNIMVALLSISAAGVGLTLTASNTVVFAQLHWTPGMLIQAEDRAHRIGQKNCVNCHYLIGENTLDLILYNYLLKKVSNVSSFVDGQQVNLEIQQMSKGERGKVSKRNPNNENLKDRQSSNNKIRLSQKNQITPIRRIQIQKDEAIDHDFDFKQNNNKMQQVSQWTDISSETRLDKDDETASIHSRKRFQPACRIQQEQQESMDDKQRKRSLLIEESSDTMRTTQILKRISSGLFSDKKIAKLQRLHSENQSHEINLQNKHSQIDQNSNKQHNNSSSRSKQQKLPKKQQQSQQN